jgi:hypothetical protein
LPVTEVAAAGVALPFQKIATIDIAITIEVTRTGCFASPPCKAVPLIVSKAAIVLNSYLVVASGYVVENMLQIIVICSGSSNVRPNAVEQKYIKVIQNLI